MCVDPLSLSVRCQGTNSKLHGHQLPDAISAEESNCIAIGLNSNSNYSAKPSAQEGIAIFQKVSVSQSYVIQKLYRTIPSFKRTTARSGDQRPVMKIHTCAIQLRAKHNGKAHNKNTHGREQLHMNGYMLGCLRGQAKLPTGAPIWLPLEFCIYLLEEAVLQKNTL